MIADGWRPRALAMVLAMVVAVVVALPAGALGAAEEAGAEEAGAEGGGGPPDVGAVEASVAAGEASARGPVTNLPLPRFVSLRAETANARRGPSLSHRVDWEFRRQGWPLLVTAEYGHWRRVRDVEGAGGWVHHSLLSGARTAVFVGTALVPLHVTRSATSAIRAYAEPGVVARLESCEDAWCRVVVDRRTDGWVPRETLWGAD